MPISKKEFEKSRVDLEKEVVSFLKAHRKRAYTSDEIMGVTNLHVDFDLQVTTKISVHAVANFVALLHDLAARGIIRRKVVNNRIYFMANEDVNV